MSKVKSYLSLIKFSHTIFAMPFALIGFFVGINSLDRIPGIWKISNDAIDEMNEKVMLYFNNYLSVQTLDNNLSV